MRSLNRRINKLEVLIKPKITQDMINLAMKDVAELMDVVAKSNTVDINGNPVYKQVDSYLTEERLKEIEDIFSN